MANDKNLALVEEPTTDLSELEQKRVQAYAAKGMPGLYELDESRVAQMLDLYLAGKPYTQISRIMKVDKVTIQYMAQKFGWYIARREYQHEIEAGIRNRVVQDKVDNQDFMLKLTHFFKKKLGKRIDSYLSTGDESHANAVDGKDIAQAIKAIETLEKLSAEPSVAKIQAPAVGLNLGDGVTVSKNEDGSVEITPKQKTTGELLKQFADAQREADKTKK